MKPLPPFRKAFLTSILLCASLLAPANGGLISAEAASVVRANPGSSSGARGRQIATLQSYLLPQAVTIGLASGDDDDPMAGSIERGIQVWSDAIPDCPFTLAAPGQKPMILVRFVDSIASGGDVQGQIETTRKLHWGSSVGYKIEGVLLVRRTTGRRDLREDELTEVIAHELGHILGLDDAEGCQGLMGPFVPGKARLKPSKDELNAVVEYRDQLRQALARLENN